MYGNPSLSKLCRKNPIKNVVGWYCDAPKPGGPLATRQPAETLVNVG